MPGRGHVEDDGDARLEEGRMYGGFRVVAVAVACRRGRGRGRGGCRRERLWREMMACRGAPTEGGGVGHHSLGQAI